MSAALARRVLLLMAALTAQMALLVALVALVQQGRAVEWRARAAPSCCAPRLQRQSLRQAMTQLQLQRLASHVPQARLVASPLQLQRQMLQAAQLQRPPSQSLHLAPVLRMLHQLLVQQVVQALLLQRRLHRALMLRL